MSRRAIRRACILAGILVCPTWLGGSTLLSASSDPGFSNVQPSPEGFGLSSAHFAIGDFDGDQKPDLASVQVDLYPQQATRYSIHLQFSVGTRSAIGLTAPFGGLLLSAKDVNGDSTLDLVVTTAVDHQLIAVLVNDGHGNFSLAEQGAFPELSDDNSCQMDAPSAPSSTQAPLLESRSPFGEEGEDATGYGSPEASESLLSQERQDVPRWHVGTSSGRSPPSARILP